MVAKQTAKRAATPRKPKADPVARARAEARAGSGPNPILVGMVADYVQTFAAHMTVSDDEADAVGERASHLHYSIVRFPAASLADICAKLPVLRDELAEMVTDEGGPNQTLNQETLRGLIADLERLSGPTPSLATTPQDAASVDFEPIAGIERLTRPEWERQCEGHFEHVAFAVDLLARTKADLAAMWAAEEGAAGAANAIERARDWLAATTALVDEALARFLVAGAAHANGQAA